MAHAMRRGQLADARASHGIGLAVVREIVEGVYGGRLELRRGALGGTRPGVVVKSGSPDQPRLMINKSSLCDSSGLESTMAIVMEGPTPSVRQVFQISQVLMPPRRFLVPLQII